MLTEQGADKLTMDALAERAGLGKGTVFRRFGTRAGIFAALLDDDEKAFQQEVLTGSPPLGPGAAPVDRLIAYGRARTCFLISHCDIARAVLDGPLLLYVSASDLSAALRPPNGSPTAGRT
jgi:AcrR family transcriptional regulator